MRRGWDGAAGSLGRVFGSGERENGTRKMARNEVEPAKQTRTMSSGPDINIQSGVFAMTMAGSGGGVCLFGGMRQGKVSRVGRVGILSASVTYQVDA